MLSDCGDFLPDAAMPIHRFNRLGLSLRLTCHAGLSEEGNWAPYCNLEGMYRTLISTSFRGFVRSRLMKAIIRNTGILLLFAAFAVRSSAQPATTSFSIEQTVATQGFAGGFCWVHARAGVVPATSQSPPQVIMTMQQLQLSGSDVFFALNEMRTTDLGASWSPPHQQQSFARIPFEFDGHHDLEVTVCDFTPKWHAHTGRLLGTGQTVVYENNAVRHVRPRSTAYAVYDPLTATWSAWQSLQMPDEPRFQNAGAGSVQRLDLPGGDVLLPVYFKEIEANQYATTVVRCSFDGQTLSYQSHGNELTIPVKRGLYEPSITRFGDRLFLTMRNDDHGYVAVSDGPESLQFSEPRKWTFDDGSDLGNYNTQQHWISHPRHGLWLVYTRRGADNDHVFRHRAPVFMAQVDPEKLQVIRATEQIVVPEKGARLGNFGITEINPDETWIIAAEWMQGPAPNPHDPAPLVARGADNRIWVTKIRWQPAPDVAIQRYGDNLLQSAVRVDHAALAHTAQLLPTAEATGSPTSEINSVLKQLDHALSDTDSARSDLIKLNLYVADHEITEIALTSLQRWCPADARPAVCTVTTALPAERCFALDAVFVARQPVTAETVTHLPAAAADTTAVLPRHQTAVVSILPQGDAVYISGQAQPGDNIAEATAATLQQLHETLKSMNLDSSDIVQVKCFLDPMSKVAAVNEQIAMFFDKLPVPAVSHVEWITGGGSRPIEIELIAAAPLTTTPATVSYLTPPGMSASPVFSRVARIHGDSRVYVSGLAGTDTDNPDTEVHTAYQNLIQQLRPARSNLRHLAKATYYVANPDVSTQLNRIRPHYYDPARPPAASKAVVRGTGIADRGLVLDLIAAPEEAPVSVLTERAAAATPSQQVVYKTIGDRQLKLHIFNPDGHHATDQRPVFLAIHGGGWTGGNANVFFPFAEYFAEQGMVGISMEYRLCDQRRNTTVFDCVRDTRSAVRWIRAHAEQLGINPDQIIVMGGSAGGHLALSAALFNQVNEDTDDQSVSARPDALILMYPVIDTSAAGYGQAKIGDRWRELSPVHNVAGQLPPALIFHGTGDDVTPYPAAASFQEQSLHAGNDSTLITKPAGRHGYIIFAEQEYQRALAQMEEFLSRLNLHP